MTNFISFIIGLLTLCILVNCDNTKSKDSASAKKPEIKELSTVEKLELKERCSKAGKAFFDNYSKNADLNPGRFWDEPEYHYNNSLNTCLIHIRYVDFGTLHSNQVIDIFENKVILYGYFSRVEGQEELLAPLIRGIPNYTSNEYFKQKKKLFSE